MKLYLIFIILISIISSQENKKISIEFSDNDNTSWWSRFNNNGLNFKKSNVSFLYQKISNNYRILIDTHISNEEIILGESYVEVPVGYSNKIKFGRYYRDFSTYLNDELSSGSMLIGINALPMPKISFLGNYEIKGNKRYHFKYGVSHAVLDKNDIYNKSPFIHEKFIYLIKKDNLYDFGFGFVHEAIWNGSTYKDGKFPGSFSDFFKVVISADGK